MCSRCVVETGTGGSKCFKSHGETGTGGSKCFKSHGEIETGGSKCFKSHGDLKLAFVITKGQFELDVICAKELTCISSKKPGIRTTARSLEGAKLSVLQPVPDVRGGCRPHFYGSGPHRLCLSSAVWNSSVALSEICMNRTGMVLGVARGGGTVLHVLTVTRPQTFDNALTFTAYSPIDNNRPLKIFVKNRLSRSPPCDICLKLRRI